MAAEDKEVVDGVKSYLCEQIASVIHRGTEKLPRISRLYVEAHMLNNQVRFLKQELRLQAKPPSYVGVRQRGKFVVNIDRNIDVTLLKPLMRVALHPETYALHVILPRKVDLLVNVMKVENLVQKYIGQGAMMVKVLFLMARLHAPSIIFMDEINSIGSAHTESGKLFNQLDGFEATNRVKVLTATNRVDMLDPALLRPGRIDRKVKFPNPNEQVLESIDLKKVAKKINGASSAELKLVCTEARMFSLRERRIHVTQEDFEMAVAKVMKTETKNMSLRKLWN
ncbi:26S protease regulatory subunit [Pyrus ussuriensis x Pyrus communis]|uniref:26S protease regulatory subunit n=1 Tax=Pyrus ussuriensis x Pyrus communis TaxID=2448454 RepID=A0A5N5HN41_9ROSA|nr:26S protease regulatory subunit [Pyrus ussuriensis x Pyrus communis]